MQSHRLRRPKVLRMAKAGNAAGIAIKLAPQIDLVRPGVISVLASLALAGEKISLVAFQYEAEDTTGHNACFHGNVVPMTRICPA